MNREKNMLLDAGKPYRVDAIDLLRGIVMIIMALDHTRDFFHDQAFTRDPLDVLTTTPQLFLTRWVTHFCAPVFVFLSGTSVFLQGTRKTKSALSAFLLKRGLWLIAVELCLMTFILSFDIRYPLFILQVIWAIGISMVLLGVAVWLPYYAILATGVAIVAGHNALDHYQAVHTGPYPVWYTLLHIPGIVPLWSGHALGIFYPFLPWTGVMLLGYCFGTVYRHPASGGNRTAIITGAGLIIVFIVLRSQNAYGDPLHWAHQKNVLMTLFSFVNTQKYPPSLLYICMTLGPALVLLGVAGSVRNRVSRMVVVYGRVPFLYYVLHFFLIHIIAALLYLVRGHSWTAGAAGATSLPFRFVVPGEGVGLGMVYLIWFTLVAALYPVCHWFSRYKQRHRHWWLSYL